MMGISDGHRNNFQPRHATASDVPTDIRKEGGGGRLHAVLEETRLLPCQAARLGGTVMDAKPLNEPILEDDYPVYGDYLYVADGRVVRSDIFGNVRRLKHDLGATEI